MFTTINLIRAAGADTSRLAKFSKYFLKAVKGADEDTWFPYCVISFSNSKEDVSWVKNIAEDFAPKKTLYVNGIKTTGAVLNRIMKGSPHEDITDARTKTGISNHSWASSFASALKLEFKLGLTTFPESHQGVSFTDYLITDKPTQVVAPPPAVVASTQTAEVAIPQTPAELDSDKLLSVQDMADIYGLWTAEMQTLFLQRIGAVLRA